MAGAALIVAAAAPAGEGIARLGEGVVSLAARANWAFGWGWILVGFLSGAVIGMGFHREEFLGGYASLRRRLVRLGHICFVALGVLNLLFALSPLKAGTFVSIASIAWIVGAVLMPAVCFLSAWRERFRALFFLPVLSLISAAVLTLFGGLL